jgi:hypothetical protein
MTLRTLTLALLLSIGAITVPMANAVLIEIEDSHEVDAETVTLPGSTAGYLLFKLCSACKSVSMQVGEETRYFLDGEEVTLRVFRHKAKLEGLMNVFYEPKTRVVTRIQL